MKYQINPGAALEFNCALFDKLTLQLITVGVDEFVDQSKNKGSIVNICQGVPSEYCYLILRKLSFLFLSSKSELFAQARNASFDVGNQNNV